LWRLQVGGTAPDDEAFFAFAVLLLLRLNPPPGLDRTRWTALCEWVVKLEERARAVSIEQSSGRWLLGVTSCNLRHATWRELGRDLLLAQPLDGTELVQAGVSEWPAG
jgi:hypothetical protein